MPSYRIIVTEHTRGPKTGNIVEKVGTYNPKTKEKQLNADRIKYWLSVGAKASATVHNMLVSEKIITGEKIAKHKKKPAEPVAEAKKAPADLPAEASAQAEGGSASGVKAPEAEAAPAESVQASEEKVGEKAETVA